MRRIGELTVDPAAREVHLQGRPVELTRLEFDLLEALSERPRVVLSRRQLLERVWGEDWYGDDHLVDVHIANLRRKLGDDPRAPRHILTVRGVGYRMGAGTGVAVATALGVSLILARRITSPVRAHADAAGQVARGRYTARVPKPVGGDELTTLAGAFNDMAEALHTSEQRRQELLADLAHELRTPLATIDGYLEGVSDGIMPSDDQTLKVLQAETARLRRLVDDLNAVSRAEERQLDLHPTRCQPDSLVTAAVQAAQVAYTSKEVTLESRIDRHLPQIIADPDRIGEVLANLLSNALRHTPPGGHVEVAATSLPDRHVQISVTDTGEGIPPELLERIFERSIASTARAPTPPTPAAAASG